MPEFVPMRNPRDYLTYEQCNALFKACKSIRDKALFACYFYTGRRTNEIVRSIKRSDIDFKARQITFPILKKNPRKKQDEDIFGELPPKKPAPLKNKTVPIKLLKLLKKHIETNGIEMDQYLFRISDSRVRQLFKKWGKDAGFKGQLLEKCNARTMRHTFARLWARGVENFEDGIELQNYMEHSDLKVTMFYISSFNPKRQAKIMDKMFGNSK